MIIWLDHLLFGNGRGLKSPCFDNDFYWLKDRNSGKSEIYVWSGWFGSQLKSFQWKYPCVGEERVLCGETFIPKSATTRFGRVMVNWGLVGEVDNERLFSLQHSLDNL